MTLRVPLGIALAIVVALSATASRAQCPFPHPASAKAYRSSLGQAFVECKTYVDSCCRQANGTTENDVPSCKPAQTFRELDGSPTAAWVWGPKSSGNVAIVVKGSDLAVSARLTGILDGNNEPVTATGHLFLLLRATLFEAGTGTMTTVDLPVGFEFPVADGKGKLKTTVSSLIPTLPFVAALTGPCRSIQVVFIGVQDPIGATFASNGIYLP